MSKLLPGKDHYNLTDTMHTIFPLVTIGYMLFCILKGTDLLCRIAAAFYMWSGVFLVLAFNNWLPGLLDGAFELLIYIHQAGTLLLCIQLFKTASGVRMRGEPGASYNIIIACALLAIILFSIPLTRAFLEGMFYYSFRIHYWPNFLIIGTFITMKVKRISLNKDEDRLLLYVAVSGLLALFGFMF
jgi:hypothetical protein